MNFFVFYVSPVVISADQTILYLRFAFPLTYVPGRLLSYGERVAGDCYEQNGPSSLSDCRLHPAIGCLVSMMKYARWNTLAEVKGLRVEHLDYLHDAHSNSIGAFLIIAAFEVSCQAETFGSVGVSPSKMGGGRPLWNLASRLGAR